MRAALLPSLSPTFAAIHRAVPTLLTGRPAVARINPVSNHPGVWRVIAQDGCKLIAKHQMFGPLTRGKPYDLLEVEETAIRLLRTAECPVPKVYGVDTAQSLIFTEWCGDHTLDDICQNADPSTRSFYAQRTIEGFSAIQTTLHEHSSALSRRTFPGCDPAGLRASWQQATATLHTHLPALATRTAARANQLLSDLLNTLGAAPPLLGPTDYNARNIVINPEAQTLHFIEFSKLGWDWPERRLVQYTTALGAGRPDGGFHTLLSKHTTARYAARTPDPQQTARLLDGHHLVFHLLAASLLQNAHSTSSHNLPLRQAWQNPKARLHQLRFILASPLSENPLTTELRTFFTPT